MMPWIRAWQFVALAMLSGCSQLPLDGPANRDIVSGASATLAYAPNKVVFDYAFVEINPMVLECLTDNEAHSFLKSFGGPAPAIHVGVGDVLEASVFESSAGGVFSPGGVANRAGSYVTFPRQAVSSSGTISVPYAGVLKVAGRTPREIEREIESKLATRAIEPQVIVDIVEQNSAIATVIGDTIVASNTVRLTGSGERILDVISKAGGLRYPAYETFVTLQRKNRSATIYFPTLVRSPEDNVFVRPGDVVFVYREQRKFVAVGAVGSAPGTTITISNQISNGTVGLFSFDQEHLSLNEAIGKAGGLLDYRADPAHVFVYRMERRKTLEGMGIDLSPFPPNQQLIPAVYRANFRDPSSFLYAQQFPMRDKDTIYVGNADAIEVSKIFAYVTLWTGTAAQVTADANTVAHGGP